MRRLTIGLSLLVLITLVLTAGSHTASAGDERGIEVGKSIPTTSMRALFITEKRENNTGLIKVDMNTCFAGLHRAHTTVTIFARTAIPPALELTSKIDELLPVHKSLHVWFLHLEGHQRDEVLKGKLRTAWTERKLHGTELAISNKSPKDWEKFGLSKDADVTVVFAKKRKVLFNRAMRFDELTKDAIAEVVAEIKKLSEQ